MSVDFVRMSFGQVQKGTDGRIEVSTAGVRRDGMQLFCIRVECYNGGRGELYHVPADALPALAAAVTMLLEREQSPDFRAQLLGLLKRTTL